MSVDLSDARAFVAVAQARGFRGGARAMNTSASKLSDAVRRLEATVGVRLLHRTTRSVSPTEAGARILARLTQAINDVEAALELANEFRMSPTGTLRLNVPNHVARLLLPKILPGFLKANPAIVVDVVVEDQFVDIVAAGCDAGIRYEERLTKNMVSLPIGPRRQRYATVASPAYLDRHGTPDHPHDLLEHRCLAGRFRSGATAAWEFARHDDRIDLIPSGPLVVDVNSIDLAVSCAVAGQGIVQLFEQWLAPALEDGRLVPVLEPWWPSFAGPFLYYHGRERLPAPLQAFIDYIRQSNEDIAA